jgi:hypothetical protein
MPSYLYCFIYVRLLSNKYYKVQAVYFQGGIPSKSVRQKEMSSWLLESINNAHNEIETMESGMVIKMGPESSA